MIDCAILVLLLDARLARGHAHAIVGVGIIVHDVGARLVRQDRSLARFRAQHIVDVITVRIRFIAPVSAAVASLVEYHPSISWRESRVDLYPM